jgi:DNA-binding IclR family transcriptional regulator
MPLKRRQFTSEEQAKLAALREEINRAVEQGGSYTDEEVAAYIERVHADAESCRPHKS